MILRVFLVALALSVMTPLIGHSAFAHEAPSHDHTEIVPIPVYNPPARGANAAASLAALNTLMASFTETQRERFMFDLNSDIRSDWSNFPAYFKQRDGVSMKDMSDEQRQLTFDFLAASLDELGYRRVAEVMAAEGVLSTAGQDLIERYGWDPENYYFAVFGIPSDTGQWGWQFGGHHLAVNMAVENGVTESLSPTHFGSEPLIFTLNGQQFENMLDTHAVGLAVWNSLNADQKDKATIDAVGFTMKSDVKTGPGKDGFIPQQEGLMAADMTPAQKALLTDAIATWVTAQPEENATRRMAEISAELDQVSFGWAGNESPTANGYYIIQGPSLIIEHLSFGSVRQVGSQAEGHYHTIYRNPQNEYGLGTANSGDGKVEATPQDQGLESITDVGESTDTNATESRSLSTDDENRGTAWVIWLAILGGVLAILAVLSRVFRKKS